MDLQMNLTVYGVNKVTVDRDTYCSVFCGQPASDPAVTKGNEVMKLSADPVVFDQVGELKPGDDVEFTAILKRAAGGKSQPYLTGVIPKKAASAATASSGTK